MYSTRTTIESLTTEFRNMRSVTFCTQAHSGAAHSFSFTQDTGKGSKGAPTEEGEPGLLLSDHPRKQ